MNVLERIDEYLQLGGLFNPELANHHAVRGLIIDCRDYIKECHEINERCNQTIKELRTVNAFESVLEDIMPIKCKNDEPYTLREPAGNFTWYVYNKRSGHIVASTYNRTMAETILMGIDCNEKFSDNYGICEQYRGPEPMV